MRRLFCSSLPCGMQNRPHLPKSGTSKRGPGITPGKVYLPQLLGRADLARTLWPTYCCQRDTPALSCAHQTLWVSSEHAQAQLVAPAALSFLR